MNIAFSLFSLTMAVGLGLVLVTTDAGFAQVHDPQDHVHEAGGPQHVVKMKMNEDTGEVYYEPARLEIKSGDTVTWVQDDEFNEHNVVSYPDGIPQSAQLFESAMFDTVGQSFTMTFTESGTYRYHCHPHEEVGMTGVIIVDRESRPEEFRKASSMDMHDHGASSDEDHVDDHDHEAEL